jgi:hypothetical protein
LRPWSALRERWRVAERPLVDQSPPPRRLSTITVVDRPDLGQARIVVGHEGIARTDDDRIAVSLFNLIVGGSGFSSRLMNALRAEEGLTYGVSSGYSLRRAPGPFFAATFTRVGSCARRSTSCSPSSSVRAAHRQQRTSSPGRARSRRAASRWGSRPPMP